MVIVIVQRTLPGTQQSSQDLESTINKQRQSESTTRLPTIKEGFLSHAIDLKTGRAITDDFQLESSTNVAPAIDYRKKNQMYFV
ncbi:unnamed protein product [Rotaria sp. Silwood1]|nr:unnamed protein product [Rotaria sp. Silwood1]